MTFQLLTILMTYFADTIKSPKLKRCKYQTQISFEKENIYGK